MPDYDSVKVTRHGLGQRRTKTMSGILVKIQVDRILTVTNGPPQSVASPHRYYPPGKCLPFPNSTERGGVGNYLGGEYNDAPKNQTYP